MEPRRSRETSKASSSFAIADQKVERAIPANAASSCVGTSTMPSWGPAWNARTSSTANGTAPTARRTRKRPRGSRSSCA